MVSLVSGLVGGLVATIAMTVLMIGIGDDSPPPTAAVWAKYVGTDPPDAYRLQGMVLHLLYGIAAGGVFAIGLPILGLSTGSLGAGLVWGVVYGVILFVVAAVLWMRVVLGLDAEIRQVALFFVFHLVYGVVLGAWVGLAVLP